MIGLMAVVMGSMMASPAWAITVDSVADIYEDQPVGLVVDGLAVDERVRIRVIEDDGTAVLWAGGRSMGGGSMTFYGMLPNNTGTVGVVVLSNLGSVSTAVFDIFGACDEDSAYDHGYADGESSVDLDWYYEAGYADGQSSVDLDSYYEAGYIDGESSVDTDSYYDAGYAEGEASAAGGSTLNCFQSSFCFHANLYWGVTQSESIHGNGGFADVEAECLSSDPGGWNSGGMRNASGVALVDVFGGSWNDLCVVPS